MFDVVLRGVTSGVVWLDVVCGVVWMGVISYHTTAEECEREESGVGVGIFNVRLHTPCLVTSQVQVEYVRLYEG